MIIALMLAVLAAATPLEEDIDFQEGRRLVDELDYERAVFRFQKLTKGDRPVEQRAAAWAWLGLTYANLGDDTEALKAFVSAVKLDPLVALPPSSPKVIQLFDKARQQARVELRADADNDGINDGDDKCPSAAETNNGHLDDDGCPDELAVVPATADTDGDGIDDTIDACPESKENFNNVTDTDGCPDDAAPPAPEGPPGLFVGGALASGIGLVGVVAGVGLGVIAASTHADALEAPFQSDRARLADSATDFATGANVAYVAGGALLVTGVILSVVSMVGGAP